MPTLLLKAVLHMSLNTTMIISNKRQATISSVLIQKEQIRRKLGTSAKRTDEMNHTGLPLSLGGCKTLQSPRALTQACRMHSGKVCLSAKTS